jgi:hypothetical integral membrane protein (TIGR02206 family)
MLPLSLTLFGPMHLAALGMIASIALALVLVARRSHDEGTRRAVAIGLAALLVLNKVAVYGTIVSEGHFTFQDALPMHLCDWSAIAAIIALIWRKQLAYELMYFWGLGGTLQATLTPDLHFDFPDIRFLTFFISHGGTLVAIAFLTLGLRMRPARGWLPRIFLWSNIYLAAAGLADWLTGGNYGYLRHKPLSASLLDHLGPWPWYIASLEGIAILSYFVYYAPFFIADRVSKPE